MQTGEFKDAFDWGRGLDDGKRPLNVPQLPMEFNQDTNTGRTQIDDLGEIKVKMVGSFTDHFFQSSRQRLGPIGVKPSTDAEVEDVTTPVFRHIHNYCSSTFPAC